MRNAEIFNYIITKNMLRMILCNNVLCTQLIQIRGSIFAYLRL
jgi:hypothetical protein